jgi:hypothetical protein
VASVELLLDGAVAGRIDEAPWKGQVDFGSNLLPHELVARGLDDLGQEMARTRQWVNLPRPAAEVGIVLEGPAAKPSSVRVSWQSRTGERPIAARVTLDDQALAVDEVGRSRLPSYDPEAPHVLSAELTFPSSVTARRDVVFGGRYGAEISMELTAVPVRLLHGRMPGANPQDASRYDPAAVRRYLAAIRVPLFMWKVGKGGPAAAGSAPWGDAEDVSTLPGLRAAVARLKDELASQRIVWVEGTHLPQAVSLSPAAKGLELP